MKFNPYESKPVTRMAFQITAHMSIVCNHGSDWYVTCGPEHDMELVHFKAHEQVNTGDWIVRLTETDTYHCTDAVFRERNIVKEIKGTKLTSTTKEEFEEFINKYSKPLDKDVANYFDPPLVTYNDFSLGKWPNCIVAAHSYGESNYKVLK